MTVLVSMMGLSYLPTAQSTTTRPSKGYLTVLNGLTAGMPIEPSSELVIDVPAFVDNGAQVPVIISTEMAPIHSFHLLAKDNPNPLIASYHFTPSTVPWIRANVKMAKTSELVLLAKSDNKFYINHKLIKISMGACD